MKRIKHIIGASLAAILLASCGGGGGVSGGGSASSVKVFGDSIADSGTFGFRFTVNQAGPNATATPIWVDKIASTFGRTLCNFYNATSFTSFVAPTLACTNFAVGGGIINSLASTGGPTSPFSIPNQMDTAASVAGGTFTSSELMLIDGGGNDAAALVGNYLSAGQGSPTAYISQLSSLLPAGSVTAMIGATGGAETLAGMYMTALANKFSDDITNKLINRGAQRIVLLNMPAVTNTPRFKLVLQSIAASPAGAAGAAQVEALVRAWTVAFNTQLNTRLGSNSKVAIVDFYSEFNTQVSSPAQFQLTNVTTPVCPVTGSSGGLPEYTFFTCTAAALDASGPAGWRNYAFSDGFHPTPAAHQLLAQLVARSIASKGWL
jgi:outer membrane lipase/esterase